MNLTGAEVRLDGTSYWPLIRIDLGWAAVVNVRRPGTYQRGDVRLPDGSTICCRTDRPLTFAAPGIAHLVFFDTGETGAEITRRMLALAA